MGSRFALRVCLLALAAACACAQQPQPDRQPAQLPPPQNLVTLHAYANLIQMPTMVLDRWGDPVKERPGQKFMISLDHGKPFPATHVRLEGEDPISLAIVIDAGGSQRDLLRELPGALAKLAPLTLTPRDHVSVYAIDCKLIRTLTDMPASAEELRKAAAEAIDAPGLHGSKPDARCAETRRLWDMLGYANAQLDQLPGRRVILAITDGRDQASKRTWQDLRLDAHHSGVAVFAISRSLDRSGWASSLNGSVSSTASPGLDALCQGSGGRIFLAEPASLAARLRDFVKLLRGRYIVQFPRARTLGPGSHDIVISVAGQSYLVRPAGISVPIAGAAELAPQPLEQTPDPATTEPVTPPGGQPEPPPDTR